MAADLIAEAERFLSEKFSQTSISTRHSRRVFEIMRDELEVEDEEVLIAGLLHDVWEDTPTEWDEIEKKFGGRIRRLIEEVSHPRKPTPEDYRAYYRQIRSISPEAKQIKLADELQKARRDRHLFSLWQEEAGEIRAFLRELSESEQRSELESFLDVIERFRI